MYVGNSNTGDFPSYETYLRHLNEQLNGRCWVMMREQLDQQAMIADLETKLARAEEEAASNRFLQAVRRVIFYLQDFMAGTFIGDYLYENWVRCTFGPEAIELKPNSVYRRWIHMLYFSDPFDPAPLKKLRENLSRQLEPGTSPKDLYHHFACSMEKVNDMLFNERYNSFCKQEHHIDENKINNYVSIFHPEVRFDIIAVFMSREYV